MNVMKKVHPIIKIVQILLQIITVIKIVIIYNNKHKIIKIRQNNKIMIQKI